jgi:hypothetical protein
MAGVTTDIHPPFNENVRPRSLAEVACRHVWDPSSTVPERQFAKAFYVARHADRPGMLAEEPQPTGDAPFDAFLGGIAEYLAGLYELPVPAWAEADHRFLPAPWDATMLAGRPEPLEELMEATPAPFRRRNIATGTEPLSTPPKYFAGSLNMPDAERFAALRSDEPRVLLSVNWAGVDAIAAEAADMAAKFPFLRDRLPAMHFPSYYLAMAINELKLRGGEAGRTCAMRLIDALESAQAGKGPIRRHPTR